VSSVTADPPRARDRSRAVPDLAERMRLISTFGAVLRTERGGLHLTQQQLADAAGLHRRSIDHLENGGGDQAR